MNLKRIYIVGALCFFVISDCYLQTYLAPKVEIDFNKLNVQNSFIYNKRNYYSFSDLIFGIELHQILSQKSRLVFNVYYTGKTDSMLTLGTLPLDLVKYNGIRTNFSYKYNVRPFISFGLGLCFEHIWNQSTWNDNKIVWQSQSTQNRLGILFSTDFYYKNFILSTGYSLGLKSPNEKTFFPTTSSYFGFSIGYLFLLLSQ